MVLTDNCVSIHIGQVKAIPPASMAASTLSISSIFEQHSTTRLCELCA
jgi:hypothetical protein